MRCSKCGWSYDEDEMYELNGNILCDGCYDDEVEYIKDEYGYDPENREDLCAYCHKTVSNCRCD